MMTLGNLHFTALDFVLIAVILLSVVISFFRGFLREAISLATWFLALFCALKFAPIVDGWLHTLITHNTMRYITSIIVIFIAVLILGTVIGKIASVLVKTSGVGFFDKLFGVIFGVARGILFGVIILLVITESPYRTASWFQNSALAPAFKEPVSRFATFLPKDVKNVTSWIERLQKYRHPMAS